MIPTAWRVMAVVVSVFLLVGPGCDKHAEDKAAIKAALEANRQAVLARDAEGFMQSISEGSIEWFDRVLRLARTGPRSDVLALRPIDRALIIALRNRVPRKDLMKFDGRSFIRWAMELGWWDASAEDEETVGSIRVLATTATVKMRLEGRRTDREVGFVKEGDAWKVDMGDGARQYDRRFREAMDRYRLDENRTILQLETIMSGREARDDLWDPPK
ncbi:MAG: hypothetical protein KIT68_05250 [Phycisphaeraceae bacterium]|nr:hypothetical protein [Phycisphaeraceae bacterium]